MSQDHLNLLAGALCLLMTVFLSGLHVVSSHERSRWMNLPRSVRFGIMAAIPMSLWRSIQFFSPEPIGPSVPGTIQAEGALYLLVLTYTIGAICVWVVRRHLPKTVWGRLDWVEKEEKRDPGRVPVMVSLHDVAEIARTQGVVAVGPKASVEELHKAQDAAR